MFLGFFGGSRSRETESTQAWKEDDLLGPSAIHDVPPAVEEIANEPEAVPASEPVSDLPVLSIPDAENAPVSSLLPAAEIVLDDPAQTEPDLSLSIAPAREIAKPAEPVLSVTEASVVEPAPVQPEVKPTVEVMARPSFESSSHKVVSAILQRELEIAA